MVYGKSEDDNQTHYSLTLYEPDIQAYRLLAGEWAHANGFPLTKEQFATMEPLSKAIEDSEPERFTDSIEGVEYTSFIQGATGSWIFGFTIDK